jgi:ATPase subunit of ABC transporter with duplicated ATPase domains
LALRWEEDGSQPPAFRAKAPSGGTSLEELRRRLGDQARPLTADLETLARQKQEEQKKKEAARREEAARLEASQREETTRQENERRRLEDLNRPPEREVSEPVRQEDSPLFTPPTPDLPPPEPTLRDPAPQPSAEPPTGQP